MDVKQQQQQQEDGFSVVSLDESFFFYYSLVRRVWIDEKKRPIVRVTGSHKHIHVFLVLSVLEVSNYSDSMTINGDTFVDYLKRKHMPNIQNVICLWIKHLTALYIKEGTKVP
jgi:hypothetical protein